jgi:hypothetical protein
VRRADARIASSSPPPALDHLHYLPSNYYLPSPDPINCRTPSRRAKTILLLRPDSALGTSTRTLSSSAPETLPRWTSRTKVLPSIHPCCLFIFLLNKACVFSTVLHRNRTFPESPQTWAGYQKRSVTRGAPTWGPQDKGWSK